jgi:pimeloyl-ACP methyl ester carboxylesterase
MRSLFNTVESADALALLHKVRVPTTLINGIFDRRIYKHTIDASSLPANISIEWVDTGHHTIYQIPQAVLDLLIPPSRKS